MKTVGFGDERLPSRFWQKVDVHPVSHCWIWSAALQANGYGSFSWQRKACLAHRVAYQELVGFIPNGLDLDHVQARGCISRACVNPAHLEPVTRAENLSRERMTPAGYASHLAGCGANQRAKTHCPRNHPYSGDNLYVNPAGRRLCKACHRRNQADYVRKKGAACV